MVITLLCLTYQDKMQQYVLNFTQNCLYHAMTLATTDQSRQGAKVSI